MADKAIGELPKAPQINDDSLLAVEQQGTAMSMTGRQFREFAEAGGKSAVSEYVEAAIQAAEDAENAKDEADQSAQQAAESVVEITQIILDAETDLEQYVTRAREQADASAQSATEAQESAEAAKLSEEAVAQSAEEAGNSAVLSESWAVGATGIRVGEDTNNSKYWADRAQSFAEQASTPAVQGVYNVVLVDRITAEHYALIVEGGRIHLLGVADTFDATDMTFIDHSTGASVQLAVDDGRLILEEV